MKNNDSQPRLSPAKTLSSFLVALAVMEVASVYAASHGGGWSIFLFTQPACLVSALIVGGWLGLTLSDTDEVSEQVASAAKSNQFPIYESLVNPAGAAA